jgi:hypothetical protein
LVDAEQDEEKDTVKNEGAKKDEEEDEEVDKNEGAQSNEEEDEEVDKNDTLDTLESVEEAKAEAGQEDGKYCSYNGISVFISPTYVLTVFVCGTCFLWNKLICLYGTRFFVERVSLWSMSFCGMKLFVECVYLCNEFLCVIRFFIERVFVERVFLWNVLFNKAANTAQEEREDNEKLEEEAKVAMVEV